VLPSSMGAIRVLTVPISGAGSDGAIQMTESTQNCIRYMKGTELWRAARFPSEP